MSNTKHPLNCENLHNINVFSMREIAYSIEHTNNHVSDTLKVLDDVRNGRNMSASFSSVKELMDDLNADD